MSEFSNDHYLSSEKRPEYLKKISNQLFQAAILDKNPPKKFTLSLATCPSRTTRTFFSGVRLRLFFHSPDIIKFTVNDVYETEKWADYIIFLYPSYIPIYYIYLYQI